MMNVRAQETFSRAPPTGSEHVVAREVGWETVYVPREDSNQVAAATTTNTTALIVPGGFHYGKVSPCRNPSTFQLGTTPGAMP